MYYVSYFKGEKMLPNVLFILNVFIQTGLSAGPLQKLLPSLIINQEEKAVSQNWHRTQGFIYYNKANFDEDHLDCLGTILSRRFILTAATCIFNSDVHLKNAIIYHDKKSYGIEKYSIPRNFDGDFSLFPDLAVLKLTKDIKKLNKWIVKWIVVKNKLINYNPQDKLEGMYLVYLNLETLKYVVPSFFVALPFQIESVTCPPTY